MPDPHTPRRPDLHRSRDLDDLLEQWQHGPLADLLHYGANGGAAAEIPTGTVHLEAMVRIDTWPVPLDPDISDTDLRAVHLARAEDAIAALQQAGWLLLDPVIRIQSGTAATWPNPADPGDPLVIGQGLDRVTCWVKTTLTRDGSPITP